MKPNIRQNRLFHCDGRPLGRLELNYLTMGNAYCKFPAMNVIREDAGEMQCTRCQLEVSCIAIANFKRIRQNPYAEYGINILKCNTMCSAIKNIRAEHWNSIQ